MGFPVRRGTLVPLYALGVFGTLLSIWGGYWDISWHVVGIVETFFTPPHIVLYSGIAIAGLATVLGLGLNWPVAKDDSGRRHLVAGFLIAFIGVLCEAVAGQFDFWWHETYGFDPFLFTPSHSLLILGMVLVTVGMAVGTVRALEARRSGIDLGRTLSSERGLLRLALISLASLWLALFGLVFLLTDVDGIAYTFGLPVAFAEQTQNGASTIAQAGLAFVGTLALLSAKRILRWRGSGVAVASITAIVMGTANLGFRTWAVWAAPAIDGFGDSRPLAVSLATFLPVYFAFLLPIAAYDLIVDAKTGRSRWLFGAALVGPFAGFLDSWHSFGMWSNPGLWIALNGAFMVFGGFLAGLLSSRWEGALLARRRAVAVAPA